MDREFRPSKRRSPENQEQDATRPLTEPARSMKEDGPALLLLDIQLILPRVMEWVATAYNRALHDGKLQIEWTTETVHQLFSAPAEKSPAFRYFRVHKPTVSDPDLAALARILERHKTAHLVRLLRSEDTEVDVTVLNLIKDCFASDTRVAVVSPFSRDDTENILSILIGARETEAFTQQVCDVAPSTLNDALRATQEAVELKASDTLYMTRDLDRRVDLEAYQTPTVVIRQKDKALSVIYRGSVLKVDSFDDCLHIGGKLNERNNAKSNNNLVQALAAIHAELRLAKTLTLGVDGMSSSANGEHQKMRVLDVIDDKGADVFTIHEDATIFDVSKMLYANRVGAVIVKSTLDRVVGIISERDIAYGLAKHGGALHEKKASELMTKALVTCAPEDTLESLEKTMVQQRIRHIPVKKDDDVVAMISVGDVLKARIDEIQLEASIFRDMAIAVR